jgi:nascent polypeptide-associated complex subunit beta
MNAEKLKKLQETVRIGGPGSVRRKKKVVHKNSFSNERTLQATVKRLGVNPIPGIEEVNFFRDDGKVLHFVNPKLQASIQANTYVISGLGQEKDLQELLPGIINQLAPDNFSSFKKILETLKHDKGAAGDEEVPDLVENFDQPAGETEATPEQPKAEPPTEKHEHPAETKAAAEKPAEQPAEHPAEKPAEKPAETPAEHPAEHPAEKPAEQPAEKPAEKPAETPVEHPAEKPAEQPAPEPHAAETPAQPAAPETAAEKQAEVKPADPPAAETQEAKQ